MDVSTKMIEQYTPIPEIEGLESLVEHLRKEYGNDFLKRRDEMKFEIGISLTPQKARLHWKQPTPKKDFPPINDFYILSALEGCITGYRFSGAVYHNRNSGVCYLPLSPERQVTIKIQLNYPA